VSRAHRTQATPLRRDPRQARGFAAGLAKARFAQRRAAQAARRAGNGSQAPVAAGPGLARALHDLKALEDEGVLSPAEFEAAKRKLLSA